MVAALARVRFGGILNSLQVVRDRDDREQKQNEDREGDKLHSRGIDLPVRTVARGKPQPETEHESGKQRPGEIKDSFHSHSGFYNKGVCGGDDALVSQLSSG